NSMKPWIANVSGLPSFKITLDGVITDSNGKGWPVDWLAQRPERTNVQKNRAKVERAPFPRIILIISFSVANAFAWHLGTAWMIRKPKACRKAVVDCVRDRAC